MKKNVMKGKFTKKKIFSAVLALALCVGTLTACGSDVKVSASGGEILANESGKIYYCDRDVTKADIPTEINGVKTVSIGENAFNQCEVLTEVTIPVGVKSIGKNAFHSCKSLKEITIPDGVDTIGELAFSSCSELISVTIPGTVKARDEENNKYRLNANVFSECKNLKDVYYGGSETDWENLFTGSNEDMAKVANVTIHYNS